MQPHYPRLRSGIKPRGLKSLFANERVHERHSLSNQGLDPQGPSASLSVAPLTTKFELVAHQYRSRFCDIWHTLHRPLASSIRACRFHRKRPRATAGRAEFLMLCLPSPRRLCRKLPGPIFGPFGGLVPGLVTHVYMRVR